MPVIVSLKGGLGNQLFQWASGYALSSKYSKELYIDTSFFDNQPDLNSVRKYSLNKIGINHKIINPGYIVKFFINIAKLTLFIKRIANKLFNSRFDLNGVVIHLFGFIFLYGDFQSERYFVDFSSEIKGLLRGYFREVCKHKIPNSIYKEKKTVIQLRRGDYLLSNNRAILGLLSDTYFSRALQCVDKNSKVYLVSDSDEYLTDVFGSSKEISYYNSGELGDFCLMISADCLIISNSTFAWWAGFLSSNEVIAPNPWYRNLNSDLSNFPIEWRRLNSDFEE